MKNSDRRTAPNTPTCWQREAPCACLRIETSDHEMHLFPYQHFVTASLTHQDGTDRLRIAFSSHDVELDGRNLRALLIALQDFAVKWMRPIPERYQRLDANRDDVITSIRVEEAK